MQDIKNKIEAVLFITGKPMGVEEIAQFCSIGSVGTVKEAIESLVLDYRNKEGSLEIVFDEGKYRLNIKRQYVHLSTKLLSSAELDVPTQATLALIAYKQPALQSEIIKMRGNTAYEHIQKLKELEFIASDKHGRTRSLKLAPKFFEYFDVLEESMKDTMKRISDRQEKLVEEEEEKRESVVPLISEKVEEAVEKMEAETVEKAPIKEKKKKNTLAQVPVVVTDTLDIERTPKEVLLRLDADDFGT